MTTNITYKFTLFCLDNGNGSDVGWDNQLCAIFTESSWGKKKTLTIWEFEKQHK